MWETRKTALPKELIAKCDMGTGGGAWAQYILGPRWSYREGKSWGFQRSPLRSVPI